MTTIHLKTGAEPSPITSCTLNIPQTLDNVQQNNNIMNQPLSQMFREPVVKSGFSACQQELSVHSLIIINIIYFSKHILYILKVKNSSKHILQLNQAMGERPELDEK
jgi:hypothetical protein